MSHAGSLKQQTPSADYSPSERFAQCCAQQHAGWKPHVPPLGMGKRILTTLKANKAPHPVLTAFWLHAYLTSERTALCLKDLNLLGL